MPTADERLAAIIDSSFDAIISKDLNSVITTWNPAAERLFGYSSEEAIGKSILVLIPAAMQGEEADIIAKIRNGEPIESYETVRVRKDGTVVAVSLTVSPVKDRSGRIVGASKIARDISASKESERRIRLLMREVNHRVKNQYAVILSMIRETGKRSADPREFETNIRERIMALARSHDLLVMAEWKGASLFELIQDQLKPFGHEDKIVLSGPMVTLQPNAVQSLGMAFHELGTNSAKYGALSEPSGRVRISWELARMETGEREFRLTWEETSVPHPQDEIGGGFGTVVLKRVTPQSLGGTATIDQTSGYLRWSMVTPAALTAILPADELSLDAIIASENGGGSRPPRQPKGLPRPSRVQSSRASPAPCAPVANRRPSHRSGSWDLPTRRAPVRAPRIRSRSAGLSCLHSKDQHRPRSAECEVHCT